jgi:farnesyl-diphosphate farnesyltransferase
LSTSQANYERELGRDLLAGVSRSFYLSLRVLPGAIRGAVGLSYMLARASDTLADADCASGEERLGFLNRFEGVILGGKDDAFYSEVVDELAVKHSHEGECRMLRALPKCMAWLDALPERDRETIRRVQVPIIRGQRLDLERFHIAKQKSLRTAEELDEYTYLVAGAVGEFWTEISMDHLPKYTRKSREEMRELGIRYGKGLQLVNILRDVGKDLGTGRCYLPANEIAEAGGDPENPAANPEALRRASKKWHALCLEHLECGMRYVESVRDWRSRLATVLPLLLGVRTMALVVDAASEDFERGVKVNRKEVKRILAGALWRNVSPRLLRGYYEGLNG